MILLGNVASISQHVPVLARKVIDFTSDLAAKNRICPITGDLKLNWV